MRVRSHGHYKKYNRDSSAHPEDISSHAIAHERNKGPGKAFCVVASGYDSATVEGGEEGGRNRDGEHAVEDQRLPFAVSQKAMTYPIIKSEWFRLEWSG